jgi:AcrR family transcriptional regulator
MVLERLLDTAVVHFGERGFAGASTREIAAASGTAMSSITYHFGGKEGLYLAVADHIAARINTRLAPVIETARKADEMTPDEARARILTLLEAFARMMLAPESAAWASFVVREQQRPTAAFERLFSGAMDGVVEAFVALLRRARPDLDDRTARATVITLYGQAMILRVARASVARVFGADSLDADTEDLLLRRLAANANIILSEKTG